MPASWAARASAISWCAATRSSTAPTAPSASPADLAAGWAFDISDAFGVSFAVGPAGGIVMSSVTDSSSPYVFTPVAGGAAIVSLELRWPHVVLLADLRSTVVFAPYLGAAAFSLTGGALYRF